MPDITKCNGEGCQIKDKCYRFTSVADSYQSYFVTPPFQIENGEFKCEMFWGKNAEQIFEQLKLITNNELKKND